VVPLLQRNYEALRLPHSLLAALRLLWLAVLLERLIFVILLLVYCTGADILVISGLCCGRMLIFASDRSILRGRDTPVLFAGTPDGSKRAGASAWGVDSMGTLLVGSGAGEVQPALRRLVSVLDRAVCAAVDAYGPEAAGDPYRGLYVGREEVERFLAREPGAPALAVDAGRTDIPPCGAAVEGTRLGWLARSFDLVAFDLNVILIALAPEAGGPVTMAPAARHAPGVSEDGQGRLRLRAVRRGRPRHVKRHARRLSGHCREGVRHG
jgi:hypothetical protein